MITKNEAVANLDSEIAALKAEKSRTYNASANERLSGRITRLEAVKAYVLAAPEYVEPESAEEPTV